MKKFISLILACCVVMGILPLTVFASMDDETAMSGEAISSVSIWSGSVADSFSSGSGTKNDPYQISTAAELAYLAKSVNEGNTYSGQYIIQKTNIDLSNISWTPIGNETTAFSGYYDGNDLNIANMSINRATSYNGLFGNSAGVISNITMKSCTLSKVDHSGFIAGMNIGTIQNCHIVNCRITNSSSYIGGIAGESYSKILNCTVRSTEILGTSSVGGLVGYLGAISLVPRYNLINNCSAINSTILGNSKIGGLCGEKGPNFTSAGGFTTDIINSHNIGTTVTSTDDYAGGILGYARNFYTGDKIYFSQCSNTGNVSAYDYSGGILGTESSFIGNGITDFTNCYNTGNIASQNAYAGGICGHSSDTFSNCHNIGMVSALSYANGICGNPKGSSYSKTWVATMNNCYCLYTATSDSIATTLSYTKFLEESSFVNWDFNNIWIMNSAVGGPILREMLDTLPEAYSNVKIIDFETLMPIANVTISSETRNNIICTSDENGVCKFSGSGFLYSLYLPMYVEKDGYKPFECCLIDFVANFENEYIEENIIFLIPEGSDQSYDPITLTIKNHLYYINTKYEQQEQLGFYKNVWNNEEVGRDKYKEATFEAYSAIDFLSKVISFDIPGIVSEVKAEADFYEAFICDIAVAVANQIPEDQIKATFLKNSNAVLGDLNKLVDTFSKTDEFHKSLFEAAKFETAKEELEDFDPSILSTAFSEKVVENVKKLFEDPLSVDENYSSMAKAVAKDFFKCNEDALAKIFTFGGVGVEILGYINDAVDVINAFHEANNAYLSALCIRTISDELFNIIELTCKKLALTDPFNAAKILGACEKLKNRSNQSDYDLYKDCLNDTVGEVAFKISYSTFLKSAVKNTVQVGVVWLLYEPGITSFDDAVNFVSNVNKSTTVFTVAFSLLDLCSSGSEKVDSYFQLEKVGEFEKAFLSVIIEQAIAVISNENLDAVREFETAFKYWKVVNQYAYKTCYIYNEKYASQMIGITWDDEERKEALENMSRLREYWLRSECHSHVVMPHTHAPTDATVGYTSQICATCKSVLPQPKEGDCGYNLTWTLYDDGELVISGTGAMWNYSYYSVPWYYNKNSIKKVTIGDGVTTIGNHAFHSCTNLASVNISDSVITIGDYAFLGCGLTNIIIPNSVTALGKSAFSACRKLTNITFSDSLTTIGESAFSSCDGLISVTIPSNITTIGRNAFLFCENLTSVTISEGVTTIGSSAFENCIALTSITIPDSVISIGSDAFSSTGYSIDSNNWENDVLYIGDFLIKAKSYVTDCVIKDGTRILGNGAFYYCYSLTSVIFPESMKIIPSGTFGECDKLRSATFYSRDVEFGSEVFTDIWGDPIENLEIYGYTGSTVEAYTSENGHTFVALPEIATVVEKTSMILGNDLSIMFAFTADDIVGESNYAVITKTYADGTASRTEQIEQSAWGEPIVINGKNYYAISFSGVAAKEMTDKVQVQVFNEDGEAISEVFTDSIRDYAMRMIGNGTNVQMFVDMLVYGAEAQKQFDNYAGNDLATSQLTAEQLAQATPTVNCKNNLVANDKYRASSLILENNIKLLFLFAGIDPTMTATITYEDHYGNSQNIIVEGTNFAPVTYQGENCYSITVDKLVVADARQLVSVVVNDAYGNEIASASDSVESYIARMSTTGTLYESILKFADSAAAILHNYN